MVVGSLSKNCQLTPTRSRLTPCLLPTCTEKYFFVPLPTFQSVPISAPHRPRVEGIGFI